jgi:hypothetical protein
MPKHEKWFYEDGNVVLLVRPSNLTVLHERDRLSVVPQVKDTLYCVYRRPLTNSPWFRDIFQQADHEDHYTDQLLPGWEECQGLRGTKYYVNWDKRKTATERPQLHHPGFHVIVIDEVMQSAFEALLSVLFPRYV